jgi:hypothetical protein
MLIAARRIRIEGYRHPAWLLGAGVVVALGMAAMGFYTLVTELPRLWLS